MPDVMTGHVVPDITLDRIKDRLSEVRGALVECPMVSIVLVHLPLVLCPANYEIVGLPH